jgi:1-acyl-sn-glycerol-3-phosphate acyltransferase
VIYRLVRGLFRAGLFGYFRRIDVEGLDRVPAEGPVLLVANHVNAFVDALLVVTRLRRPVTLTAKATLRADPLLRPLLGVLRVVTFRRGQDEASPDPGRNRDAFDAWRRARRCASSRRA